MFVTSCIFHKSKIYGIFHDILDVRQIPYMTITLFTLYVFNCNMRNNERGPIGDILRLVREDIILYREGFRMGDYMLCLDAVRGWNALFPSERLKGSQLRKYGIIESTKIYNELSQEQETIQCPNRDKTRECETPTIYETAQITHRDITSTEILFGGERDARSRIWSGRKMPVWTCPDCHNSYDMCNISTGQQILQSVKPEAVHPNFLRVVPHPPDQADYDGVDGLRRWGMKMRPWLHRYSIELHSETSRYRNDKMAAMEMIPDEYSTYDFEDE